MIDVIVTDTWAGREQGRALAHDPESALVAARTMYDDVQAHAAHGLHVPCTTVFAVDGNVAWKSAVRP